jgi:hemolysin D
MAATATVASQLARGAPGSRNGPPPHPEFLPATIEIEETPPSPAGRALLWTLIGLSAAALLWATLGHVDIVAVSPGKLVPSGQVKLLQSLSAGTVKAIHVTDGERVRAGQALIELDPTLAEADRDRASGELEAARQELGRYQAFVDAIATGRSVTDGGGAALAPAQRTALAESVASHRSRLAQLAQSLKRRQAELDATEEQVAKLRRTLPLIIERANAITKLSDTGLVARQTALEIEQQRIEAEQDLAAAEATARATRAAMGELTAERQTVEAEARRVALERIAELETRVAALSQENVKTDRLAAETTLRAPVDGEVQQLAVHTVGGVIKPGETLLVVVPEGPALEVEALVLNKDIGFVHEGAVAAVKLDAFPFTRYGALEATVAAVGEDAMPHERLGPVYPVRLAIANNAIRVDGEPVRLSAGMAASVEVKTGKRRILDYLLSPIARARDESLRER